MGAGAENEAIGAALFDLRFCCFDGQGKPPSVTREARLDRLVHSTNRDTEVSTADVTTSLSTVSIRFDTFPNQPGFGLTANPGWPSTLITNPRFTLPDSDS